MADADDQAKGIKKKIRELRKEPASSAVRKEIKRLYKELDRVQFKPDYMCLVVDKVSDYRRACKGFSINGVKYCRLLGTPGGIKMSTVVFVSERVYPELTRRINNDRNMDKKFVPAKLEAYKALACSASTPVSWPRGVLVVKDLETTFQDYVIDLRNDGGGEPVMSEPHMRDVTITPSDGCGMMLPSLAARWSAELHLDYIMSCCNTRNSFEKGCVFTFPFDEFASQVAHGFMVKDAWGNTVDIRNVELVLTTSMLKLWDSYSSIEDYLDKCMKNGYTFAVTKTSPRELESMRRSNYQFIQSFNLNDDDIEELIAPTIQEVNDVLTGDWRKTTVFLKGAGLNDKNVRKLEDDFVKAMMIEPELMHDPYIRANIYRRIKNRINEAKIGVINLHANYSIICGDLYALCQHIFGLPVTGILRANEVWNGYWADQPSDELLCFRAPMSCHENIRRVIPAKRDEVRWWFRHMQTCTVLSAWSNEMAALNGCDFDGDILMLTDNPVLLRKHRILPTLCCGQNTSTKCIPTDDDFIQSNINSFGNEVGQITNRVTAMYEVAAGFAEDSEENAILQYRIRCGQQFQQDSIKYRCRRAAMCG